MAYIKLGNIRVEVVKKDIKNLHLSVYPPNGRVHISAPQRMDLDTIRIFALSKLCWIKKQQVKLREQEREAARDYINRESHYLFGRRYLMKVIEQDSPPRVIIRHDNIELSIRPDTSRDKRREIIEEWYRSKLKELIPVYIEKYSHLMKIQVHELGIKKMKTRWGTCNKEAGRIWLNLELAKKPRQCIEYIIVHEMVHLLEHKHGSHFVSLMDKYFPLWKKYREELNKLPIGHREWGY